MDIQGPYSNGKYLSNVHVNTILEGATRQMICTFAKEGAYLVRLMYDDEEISSFVAEAV